MPVERAAGGTSLIDVLDRVLDKGIVIAGDIQINLLDIELLTIKLRLLVASVDKAKEMGIDWWEADPALNAQASRLQLMTVAPSMKRNGIIVTKSVSSPPTTIMARTSAIIAERDER